MTRFGNTLTSRIEGCVLSLLLALVGVATCVSCVPKRHFVPLVARPDTRSFTGVRFDSAVFTPLINIYKVASPTEVATCLYGHVRVNELAVDRVMKALKDSADKYHVFVTAEPPSGCVAADDQGVRLIGVSHDHTQLGPQDLCTHSDPDAFVLFEDKRLLFSMVVCNDGWLEILWQDGRRFAGQWGS